MVMFLVLSGQPLPIGMAHLIFCRDCFDAWPPLMYAVVCHPHSSQLLFLVVKLISSCHPRVVADCAYVIGYKKYMPYKVSFFAFRYLNNAPRRVILIKWAFFRVFCGVHTDA